MKFGVWRALARGVLLESLRRKDLWVVAILGLLIMLSAGALGFFGMHGLESFAKDLAATVLGGFSTILAILCASRLMPEEIKNRTLYPLLSRPISRFDLLMGKLVGAILVSWISFGILCGLTFAALAVFQVAFEPIMAQYVLAKMMGLVVVCALSLTLSLYMTPSASATLSFILCFGTAMMVRGLVMAAAGASAPMAVLFKAVNFVLPQISLFDFGSRMANQNWGAAPAWVIGWLALYMTIYSLSALALGHAKFKRQAL